MSDIFVTRISDVIAGLKTRLCRSCRFCKELRRKLDALQLQCDDFKQMDSFYPLINAWFVIDAAGDAFSFCENNLATFAPTHNAKHNLMLTRFMRAIYSVEIVNRKFWLRHTIDFLRDRSLFTSLEAMTEQQLCTDTQLLRFCARLLAFVIDDERCEVSNDGVVTVYTHALGKRRRETRVETTRIELLHVNNVGLKRVWLEELARRIMELRRLLLRQANFFSASTFGNFVG